MNGFITIKLYDEDTDIEEEFDLPSKMEVCSHCEGHGTHLTPSIGEHAYTSEEFCEEFDEEQREEYFKRGGIYDVTCYNCKGKNVVSVIDRCACEGNKVLSDILVKFDKQEQDRYYSEAESRAERRMEEAMERSYY
jgi:RecJ-like exonuclease